MREINKTISIILALIWTTMAVSAQSSIQLEKVEVLNVRNAPMGGDVVDYLYKDKTYNVLNKRRPADFPAVKDELLGGVDSSVPHTIRPITMEAPEEEEPAEDSETPPSEPTNEAPEPSEDSPQPESPDGE